jgi:4-amino-4-deoxy-L-arabinose transferase-like glycosyltransferase
VKRTELVAVILAILGSLSSVWVSHSVYEGLPHLEDEFAFLWQAEVMAGGRIKIPTPFESRSHLVPFVVDDDGYRFGKYPPGWPAALSLGARSDVPWAVNALLAGFSIWLIYRLGSKVAGERAGIIAAILSLTSPMFLMLSGSLLSHIFSLFLTCAFALAWLELFPLKKVEDGDKRVPAWMLVLILGMSLGLLAITRPLTAVGVGLPFILQGLWMFIRRRGMVRKQLIGIGVVTLLLIALLPLWNAAMAGDPMLNPYTLWWEYDRIGFGPGVGVTESGHNLFLAWWNLRWSLRTGVHDLFGWPYISWIFLPFGLVALRRKWEGWLLFSIFPALMLCYMAYWVGSWLYGPRYYFEALPGLAVVSAMGILWLGGWLKRTVEGVSIRRAISGSLVLVLIFLNLRFYLPPRLAMMNQLNGIARSHLEPFESANLGRAVVIVHTLDRWTEYGTLLTLTAPFAESDLVLVISRGQHADARLASGYSGWEIYHYYPDTPNVFYREPRTTVVIVE